MKKMNIKLKVQFDKTKPDGMPRKCLDVSIAKRHGWKPVNNLDIGFESTLNYFVKKIKIKT